MFNLGINLRLINNATAPLRSLRSDLGRFTNDMRTGTASQVNGLRQSFAQVRNEIRGASRDMQQMNQRGRDLQGVGLGQVAAGVGLVTSVIKPSVDAIAFERGMAEVATLTDMSLAELSSTYSRELLNIASDLGQDQGQVVQAMYDAISAGVDPSEVTGFLRQQARAAVAGVTDIATAVDLGTTIRNAYGLPMEDMARVNDVIFTTVKAGKTTFDQIAANFSTVGANAASAGVSFEHVQTSLARLTATGVPTAQAYTQINNAITALSNPVKGAQDQFKALGLTINAETLASQDLIGTFDMIAESMKGMGRAERAAAIGQIFTDVESRKFFQSYMNDSANYIDVLEQMRNANGATDAAFEKMAETTGFAWDRLRAQVRAISTTVGLALLPGLNRTMDVLMQILGPVQDLAAAFPGVTAAVVSTVGAFGGLMIGVGIFNLLKGTFLQAFGVIKFLVTAVRALSMAFLANPIVLIIAAIAGAAYLVYRYWGPISEFFRGLWGSVATWTRNAWESVTGWIAGAWERVSGIVSAALAPLLGAIQWYATTVIGVWRWVGATLLGAARAAWGAVSGAVSGALGAVMGVVRGFAGGVATAWSALWRGVSAVAGGALEAVASIVRGVASGVMAAWRWLGDGLLSAAQAAWGAVSGAVSGALGVVMRLVRGFAGGVATAWSALWRGVSAVVGGALEAVASIVRGVASGVMAVWRWLGDGLLSAAQAAWAAVRGAVSGGVDAVMGVVRGFSSGVAALWAALWDGVTSVAGAAWDWLRGIVDTGVQGLLAAVDGFVAGVSAVWSWLWETVPALVSAAVANVLAAVAGFASSLMATLGALWDGVTGGASAAWGLVTGTVQTAVDAVVGRVQGFAGSVMGTMGELWGSVVEGAGGAWTSVTGMVGSAWDGILGYVSSGVETMQNLLMQPLDFVRGLGSMFTDAGRNIVDSVVSGITSRIGAAREAIGNVTSTIRGYLPFSPAKEGALRDLDRVRVVETFAEGIRPGPAVDAISHVTDQMASVMRGAGDAMTLPVDASPVFQDLPEPVAGRRGAGGVGVAPAPVEINYQPQVTLGGSATEQDREDIMGLLRSHSRELVDMVQREMARRERVSY